MKAIEYENTLLLMVKNHDYLSYCKLLRLIHREDQVLAKVIHMDILDKLPKHIAEDLDKFYIDTRKKPK